MHELDQKIQMEAYLREKKEAILRDRRNQTTIELADARPTGMVLEDDQKSCLQQVQEKFKTLREEVADARSRAQTISKAGSVTARS